MTSPLRGIIAQILPDGLPSKDEIEKMDQNERDSLFEKQQKIIHLYKVYTSGKLTQIQMQLIDLSTKLTILAQGQANLPKPVVDDSAKYLKSPRTPTAQSIKSTKVEVGSVIDTKAYTKVKTPKAKQASSLLRDSYPTKLFASEAPNSPGFGRALNQINKIQKMVNTPTRKTGKKLPIRRDFHN